MFKVNNRSTRCCPDVFITNFEDVNGKWNNLLP